MLLPHAGSLFIAAVSLIVSPLTLAAQRTFVATTGSDAHACSLTQPCRSFATALIHTDAGGEIVVLDSGGYGRVTISKSVTITAPAGVHAGISVFAGTNGIDIPAGGVTVVLRGLSISGQGGTHGIYVSGDNELTIERCDIGGMSGNGIHLDGVAGTVQMRDTVVHDNGGMGIMLFGPLSAALDRMQVERNTLTGIYVTEGPTVEANDMRLVRNNRGLELTSSVARTTFFGDGVRIGSNNHEGARQVVTAGSALLVLTRGEISHNPDGGVLVQAAGGGFSEATFTDSVFSDNGIGITVDGGAAGGSARTLLVRNAFYDDIADFAVNGGHIKSGGGNALGGATAYGAPEVTFSF